MNGKNKCKILKEIRQKIAEENDIELVTSECKYQGECSGTCPKCEEELRYLERELKKRQMLGKGIAVAGVAAALVLAAKIGEPIVNELYETITRDVHQGFMPPDTINMSVDDSFLKNADFFIDKIK